MQNAVADRVVRHDKESGMSVIHKWYEQADDFIWNRSTVGVPAWQMRAGAVLRFVYVIVRDLAAGQLNLRAMSLVYTTLLSLVPLLAFSFSVLKGLGVHNRIEPMLYGALDDLGPSGNELAGRIMGFVENVRADVLGTIGLVILIYLIISLVQKVEASFNYVWHVQQPRSFAKRFSNYLTVILIGPLLISAAVALSAAVSNNEIVQQILSVEPLGTLMLLVSRLLPYLIVIGTFTFVYIFVPNTDVKSGPAFAGGIVAGIAWQTAGWAFATFIVGSGNYVAIYSSFAIVLTFMIWLYLNWLILLVGAQVAFYLQNPNFIEKTGGRLTLSSEMRERLAMDIMYLVGKAFREREPVWNVKRLADHFRIPADALGSVTQRLERCGLLMMTDEKEGRFVPGTDIEQIGLEAIRAAVRGTDPELDHDPRRIPITPVITKLADEADKAARVQLEGNNLRDLLSRRE